MVGCMFTAVMCCIAEFQSFKYCPMFLHLDALGSLRNFEVKLYPGAGCLCVLKLVDLSWSTWVYRPRFWSPATVGSSRGLESFRSLKSFALEWSCMSVLCLCDRLGPHHGSHNETMQSCGFGRRPRPGSILSQCFFPIGVPVSLACGCGSKNGPGQSMLCWAFSAWSCHLGRRVKLEHKRTNLARIGM